MTNVSPKLPQENFTVFTTAHHVPILSQFNPVHAPSQFLRSRLISVTNLMHKFFYSITICMLRYNPRHASSINMPIFRGTNCIITASGIVTLCKRLYSMPDERRLQSALIRNVTYILLMNKGIVH